MDVPDEQDLRLTLAKPSKFAKRTQNPESSIQKISWLRG